MPNKLKYITSVSWRLQLHFLQEVQHELKLLGTSPDKRKHAHLLKFLNAESCSSLQQQEHHGLDLLLQRSRIDTVSVVGFTIVALDQFNLL